AAAGALLRRFETPEQVYFARPEQLREVAELDKRALKSLENKDTSRADRALGDCERLGFRILTVQDAEYPERLRNIYDPPTVLYVRGRLPAIDEEPVVAIVGTRTCTPYGIRSAENIGYGLARSGIIVTTGLAKGVDSAAAVGALRGGGRVIGVLGGGIDVIYPRNNGELYDDVAAAGALISEYPPGTETASGHFPVRNRIMSGISLGVAVIEAPAKSGALITAARALEQGRDVFATPGNVDSESSVGANALLRDGAIALTGADDIISEYAALFPGKIRYGKPKIPLSGRESDRLVTAQLPAIPSSDVDKTETSGYSKASAVPERDFAAIAETLSGGEKAVFLAVSRSAGAEGIYIDDIIAASGLTAAEALASITMLEIEGHVKSLGSGFFTV
ncbi:MAG: DNA-processing protein DprA, partial [Oscillospiraceae bacterium]|nr:DNA-processing protein DprA [Oscillospiraceae bacterium]